MISSLIFKLFFTESFKEEYSLEDLYEKAYPAAQAEWKEMEDFAAQNLGLNTLEKWDTAYVSEKFKQSHLELDEQELKPYFPLEMAKAGVFDIAKKRY